MLFPLWRLAGDPCNLVIESPLDNLKKTYEALDLWGFCHRKTIKRWRKVETYFVVGAKGDAPEIPFGNTLKTPFKSMNKIPGPRLVINPPYEYKKPGWDTWEEDFYALEDLYRFPLRKNYVQVDPQMLFAAYRIRKAISSSQQWRWQIGDAIGVLIEMGLTMVTAVDFASEVTGLSVSSVRDMYTIAQEIPAEKRNYQRTWGSYREQLGKWSRSHVERIERSTTYSGVGNHRTKNSKSKI